MDKNGACDSAHSLEIWGMYSIIGGDDKTYGPVSADEVRRWIREGRADERTKVKQEGTGDWKELGSIEDFYPSASLTPPKINALPSSRNLCVTGELRIRDCLAIGWHAYLRDPWRTTGIVALVFIAQFVMNSIPVLGALLAFLLNGPILGGLYFFCQQVIRGKGQGISDVTTTVKERFLPCFLATTVSSLLAFGPFLLGIIPAMGLFAGSGIAMEKLAEHPNLLLGMGLPIFAGFLGMMYFLISWSFAVPIAGCSTTDFWEAMKLSWRGVQQNFLKYFALLLILAFLNLLGALCLIVGLFVTVPLTLIVTMAAYEQIFRATDSR